MISFDRNDRWCLPATVSFGPTCGFQRDMRHVLQFLKGGNPKAPFQKGMTSLEHFIMQGHILLLKGDTLRGRLWERRTVRHRGRYTYNNIQSWNILKLRGCLCRYTPAISLFILANTFFCPQTRLSAAYSIVQLYWHILRTGPLSSTSFEHHVFPLKLPLQEHSFAHSKKNKKARWQQPRKRKKSAYLIIFALVGHARPGHHAPHPYGGKGGCWELFLLASFCCWFSKATYSNPKKTTSWFEVAVKWILQFMSLRSSLFLLNPLDSEDSKHSQWPLGLRWIDVPAKAVLLLPWKEARDVAVVACFLGTPPLHGWVCWCFVAFLKVFVKKSKPVLKVGNLPSRNSHSIFPSSQNSLAFSRYVLSNSTAGFKGAPGRPLPDDMFQWFGVSQSLQGIGDWMFQQSHVLDFNYTSEILSFTHYK